MSTFYNPGHGQFFHPVLRITTLAWLFSRNIKQCKAPCDFWIKANIILFTFSTLQKMKTIILHQNFIQVQLFIEVYKLSSLHVVFQYAAQTIATLGTGATVPQKLIISRLSKNKMLDLKRPRKERQAEGKGQVLSWCTLCCFIFHYRPYSCYKVLGDVLQALVHQMNLIWSGDCRDGIQQSS